MNHNSMPSWDLRLVPDNWDDIRFFVAVADAGTLAQASRDLGVKVSTVHRRLGSLEEQWNVQLFERTPKGHSPTPDGVRLLAGARRVHTAVLDLTAEVATLDRRSVIRLTATDDLLEFLSEHVAAFCADHDIQVRLISGERVYNLAQREADVAIRFAAPTQDELVVRELGPMGFALYASPSYVDRFGAPSGADDFSDHRFAMGDETLADSAPFKWLAERVAPAQVVAVANTVSTLVAAARGGIGIAPLPCLVADPDRSLVRVHPPLDGVSVRPRLMYHYRSRSSPELQTFVAYLEEVFLARQSALAGNSVG